MADEKKAPAWREAFFAKGLFSDEQKKCFDQTKAKFASLADYLEKSLPEGRYKSMLKTDLERAAMTASKSITHEGHHKWT